MAEANYRTPPIRDTTCEFLRSFSVVECDSESEFEELPPIPETADVPDGPSSDVNTVHDSAHFDGPIPFNTIFEPAGTSDRYNSSKKASFWIRNIAINVKITSYERDDHVINPYRYTIEVTHAEHQWTLHKRYKHFRQLHDALALFRAKYRIPFPRTGEHRERQKTLRKEWRNQERVRFPLRPDTLVREEKISLRMKQLEGYLQNLLQCKSYRNHPETLKFFEVSHLSFVSRLGLKNKEGMVKKCSGGRRISIGCCGCLQKVHFAGTWNRRWLVLKDTFLAYVRPEDGVISDVMLMDADFKVESGMLSTGAKHGLLISNMNRHLLLKCWTSRKAKEWAESIKKVATDLAMDFTKPTRFSSFAPVRTDSCARWFVDAKSYFEAVADALEKAKEEIYITDWWLSPEIYMKRPMVDGDSWRLDVILKRKATQGVRVFVLLYKEVEAALMIKSIYSKQILMQQHPNIKVLRHPDHIPGKGVLLWAHHEKLVAIDQQIAFLGGIDLCYGRWDDAEHRLTDLGSIVLKAQSTNSISTRAENSIVTNMTEVADDLIPLSHQVPSSSKMPSKQPVHIVTAKTVTDHQDVNVLLPSSQLQEPGDLSVDSSAETESLTPKKTAAVDGDTSKKHVFADVVVKSDREETADSCEDAKDSDHMEHRQDKEASVVSSEQDDVLDSTDASGTRSTSTESTSSATSTGRKHLWANPKNGKPKLRLYIPKSKVSQTADSLDIDTNDRKGSLENSENAVACNVSSGSQSEDSRLRSTSSTSEASKTSDSMLIDQIGLQKVENTSSPPPAAKSEDSVDFANAARILLKMSRNKQEKNNNEGQSDSGHNKDEQSSPAEESQARRRWKLVINVQKFESVARHTQTPEKIPEELLTPRPNTAKETKHRVPPSFRQLVQSKFRTEHRSDFELTSSESGMHEHGAEQWGMYRTASEQDILERGLQGSTKLWIGKDYVNFIYKDFVNLHHPFEDFIDRKTCPRMPWHDIGAVVYGKAARDVSRHFIGRWNFTKLKKYKRNTNFPLLLPKQYAKMHIPQAIRDITYPVRCQILRSICGWSGGIESVEMSIHAAYEFCIENAKHYIYIENQFFITQVGADETSVVSNQIATALYRRILRAHRNGEDFKVYVMMPLLPAFEGEFGTHTGVALQAVTHWNYASMCRGSNSLMDKLVKGEVPEPSKYIVFCGLRKWGELNGKLVTELIYVHSKLMIVDDNTVIIGSANINDRSMLGKRDSELAVIIEDTSCERIHCNDHFLEPGQFGSSLRHTIFREHLGLSENDVEVDLMDVSVDSFYKDVWIRQAAINTTIFEKVFSCLPTNQVKNFQELRQYTGKPNLATTDPKEARIQLSKVKGHVVLMPLFFLNDENLTPRVGQKEALLPSYLWT